jgi:hypothetical protein
MKTQLSFRIILTGALVGLLSACATYPSSGPAALVGTWTNSLGTVWTIKADNTFDVVVGKHHLLGQSYSGWRYCHNPRSRWQARKTLLRPGRLQVCPHEPRHPGVHVS